MPYFEGSDGDTEVEQGELYLYIEYLNGSEEDLQFKPKKLKFKYLPRAGELITDTSLDVWRVISVRHRIYVTGEIKPYEIQVEFIERKEVSH